MKRWAVITVGLYGLLLLALTLPLLLAFSFEFEKATRTWGFSHSFSELAEVFAQWGYWLWLGLLVLCQALLLVVPVDLVARRQPTRRKLLVPTLTATFLLANVFYAGVFAVAGALWGDDASIIVEKPANLAEQAMVGFGPTSAALKALGITRTDTFFAILTAIGMLLIIWAIWALIFFHYAQADEPEGLVRRATRWLIRASILEMLVAIPSHVITRHRDDCCAPIGTMWGIVTGLVVMLLAFGPGVFFLFAKRMQSLQPKHPRPLP
jgi:hypothetical protein